MNKTLKFSLASLILSSTLITTVTLPFLKNQNSVFAKTPEEKMRNMVYNKANCATVTVQAGGGHGSGFSVNSDGLIITNAHVLEDAPPVVTVVLADGKKVGGNVIGFAKNGLDLAAVKIPKQPNLCQLNLADSNSLQVGDSVFAMGSPLDPDNARTFTEGIISKINAREGMIQHTAFIKHGNSGGPLLNSNGELIGVNTEIELDILRTETGISYYNAVGIGFAIPITQIKTFLTAINKADVSDVSTLPENKRIEVLSLNGENINGNLTKYQQEKYYFFKGKAGQKITVEINSDDFEPKLVLYKEIPLGNNQYQYQPLKESTDKGMGDVTKILEFTLTEDADYVIEATTKAGVGAYSLRGFSN